ncbi:PEPxxWA-CTERM sorting domain-containing protein [Sphingosinicellaceae bacterium]|nr:PEPxxWA-CTERM sorting domain-containing protein [Sphingosinicellaceae bacterium]
MKLKNIAFAATALFAAASANAATTVIDFNNGTAPGFSGSYSLFMTSIHNVATGPNASPFLAVPIEGAKTGTATYTSSNFITSISFDWGTPDSYNTLSAVGLNGTTALGSGGSLAAGRYTFNFLASDQIKSINFTSTDRAFEIDNLSVSAVPEPASWALMVGGFMMVGFAARRRSNTVAA